MSDLSWVNTDTNEIVSALVASYESITKRTLYPADPAKLFIDFVAAIIVQQNENINYAAKMNIPSLSSGEYLDALGGLFKDVTRLSASAATTTLRFTISAAQETALTIPANTRVTTSDGKIKFYTTEAATVTVGETTADVSAVCETVGAVGNGFAAEQLNQCVDVFPLFSAVENLTETAGGADVESDADFYERMKESTATFSTAGASEAYIYFAKSASPQIEDVSVSATAGAVDVRILCQNGTLPTDDIISTVQAALSSSKVRPLTDSVTVQAPSTTEFDVTLTYYISQSDSSKAESIKTAIGKAVDDYIAWQIAAIGRDINPSKLMQMVMAAGAKRVSITAPTYATVNATTVAQLDDKTVTDGGLEDG